MSVTIVITGLDAVSKRFGISVMDVIRPALLIIGNEAKTKLQHNPGPAHSPVLWASAKQRRWWFAHRREKGLPDKYTRGESESQDLLQSWTVQPSKTGVVVGTRTLYAPWVQSAQPTPWGGPQTAQHKATGWVTDEKVAGEIESEGIAVKAVTAALMAALQG